mgnify:CR=1 FL=1
MAHSSAIVTLFSGGALLKARAAGFQDDASTAKHPVLALFDFGDDALVIDCSRGSDHHVGTVIVRRQIVLQIVAAEAGKGLRRAEQ